MLYNLGKQIGTLALNSCFVTTQLATCPLDWWMSRRIGLQVHMPRNLYVPPGTLVIANHRSMLDPFLITYHLGSHNWFSTIPTRYPMTSTYARRLVVGPALKMLGAYDIGKTSVERAKKLLFTRDLLDHERTVLLFPEGKLVERGVVVDEFQQGARMLFAHDYPTLFVHLSGFTTSSFVHPRTVTNAQMRYSEIVRGDAATKLKYMGKFFSERA
ncbi:MAG: 1-acyl-sn-glycerol-3-phosphate acyltransferase [Minisyncoccota bacterium]